jgi:hypothetical protein
MGILDFRREEAENYTFLGYYAANSGNFLLTFRDKLSAHKRSQESKRTQKDYLGFLTPENSDPFYLLTPE